MRRTTQNTISDRIFGICQDRQAVAVVGIARLLTALLRLWGKRAMRRDRREYHAPFAWFSAGAMAPEHFSCRPVARDPRALDRLGFVEVVASGRC